MWRREVSRRDDRPARIARSAGDSRRSIISYQFTRNLCSGVSGGLRATSRGPSRSRPASHMMEEGHYAARSVSQEGKQRAHGRYFTTAAMLDGDR